jgi:hypothetical protein
MLAWGEFLSSYIFTRFFFIFAEPTGSAWLGFYDHFSCLQAGF